MKKLGLVIGSLLIFGMIFVLAGLSLGGETSIYWDKSGVQSPRGGEDRPARISELNTEAFVNISIAMVNHDVEFIVSDSYGFEIVSRNNSQITWHLQNGSLAIKEKFRRGFFDLDFSFLRKGDSYLKVYIPADAYLEKVFVNTVNGKVELSGFTCALLDVNVVSGRVEIEDVSADILKINGVSGTLAMRNCNAQSVNICTISGKISISGLKSNGLSMDSVSGRIAVSGELLGRNEINSVSGRVSLLISGSADEYSKQFSLISGSLSVNGQRLSKNHYESGSPNSLKVNTVSGGVAVDFRQ